MQVDKTTASRGRKPAARATAAAAREGGASATALPEALRQQAICQAAYALYQARGCVDGDALADWLAAEAQVDQALAAQSADSLPAASGH